MSKIDTRIFRINPITSLRFCQERVGLVIEPVSKHERVLTGCGPVAHAVSEAKIYAVIL
jgi:hypothetical protein